jgi:hypothetical protein
MEETVNLVKALDRLVQAVGKVSREVVREVAVNALSPLQSIVAPLRWLEKHVNGTWNRDLTLATGDVQQFMKSSKTWEPYMAAYESVRSTLLLHPEIEARNKKIVEAWNRFKEAGTKKEETRRRHGVHVEVRTHGQILSLPFTPPCADLGFRLLQISPENPVYAIRVGKSVVDSSDLALIVIEFIMGAQWSMQSRERMDFNKVSIDEMALKKAREGLAKRLELLLEQARKVAASQSDPDKVSACGEVSAIPDPQIEATTDHASAHENLGDSLKDLEPESPCHDSFLGLMLSAPAGAPLRSGSVFLCANVQSACAQSSRLNSLAQLEAILWTTGTAQEKASFLSSVAFAQEMFAEENWELLERERGNDLRRLAKEYGRLDRQPFI